MIPEDKITEILAQMASPDMDMRLKAFQEGKLLFNNAFADCESVEDYALTANALEMAYNLVRTGLKKEAVKITDLKKRKPEEKKETSPATKAPRKKKGTDITKVSEFLKSHNIDLSKLLAQKDKAE